VFFVGAVGVGVLCAGGGLSGRLVTVVGAVLLPSIAWVSAPYAVA